MHKTSLASILAVLGTILAATPLPVAAATFTVSRFDDPAPDACNSGVDCSLREAVMAANSGAGSDTIILAAGSYALTLARGDALDDTDASLGDLDISWGGLTIQGAGSQQTVIDASALAHRAFDIPIDLFFVSGTVSLSGLTVAGGNTSGLSPSTFNRGGAISATSRHVDLVLDDVVLTATTSGSVLESRADLDISNSRISIGNSGTGLRHTNDGTQPFQNVRNVTITNSDINGNGSHGIFIVNAADVTIDNTTISGNGQHGLLVQFNNAGDVTQLTNVTIANNGSHGIAGIGYTFIDTFVMPDIEVVNTIVANNTGGDILTPAADGNAVLPASEGYNLIGDTTGLSVFTAPTDLNNVDPLLQGLDFNGGTTASHDLATLSPAVDAGNTAVAPATDQRGVSRPQNTAADIGSLEFTGPFPEPDISVAPGTLNFGGVDDGASAQLSVTVDNEGSGPLIMGTIAAADPLAPPFAVVADDCSGQTLAPAGSCGVTVEFAPTAVGDASDTFDIPSNDPDTSSVTIEAYGTGNAAPDIALDTDDIDFGMVAVSDSLSSDVEVTNEGSQDLSLSATTLGGADSDHFSATHDCDLILAGGSCTLTLTFEPTSVGFKQASYTIQSNDPDEGSVAVLLSGTAIAPDISLSTTSIDLGAVRIGAPGEGSVIVTNVGDATLVINDIDLTGTDEAEFDHGNDCGPLAPDAFCTVTAELTPTSLGAKSATLTIFTNDPDESSVDIDISGVGVEPDIALSTTALVFDETSIGSMDLRSVVVTNEGGFALDVASVSVGGDHTADFEAMHDCDASVAPAGTCTIDVTFAPTTGGDRLATLTIASDDPDEGSLEVTLSGLGATDDDGVSDAVEDGAPNGGDGNDDGTPDREQPNVTSLPNVSGDYVTFESPPGTVLLDVMAIESPSPGDAPIDVVFPQGFFALSVGGLSPGEVTTVTMILHTGEPPNTYYKYSPEPDDGTDHWYEFIDDGMAGAELNDNVVTLHFVDGERGDADLASDGLVIDPGGPGIAAGAGDADGAEMMDGAEAVDAGDTGSDAPDMGADVGDTGSDGGDLGSDADGGLVDIFDDTGQDARADVAPDAAPDAQSDAPQSDVAGDRAGTDSADATPDTGTGATASDDGCGCRAASSPVSSLWLLALGAILLPGRRRQTA